MKQREIKFRVWDKFQNKFLDYPCYFNSKDSNEFTAFDRYFKCDEEGCIVQQYTGLKDKNDREIYEGDIIICHPDSQEKCIVDWSPDGIWWATDLIQPPEREHYGQELYMYPKCQVIGNILENPDLLK